MIKLKTTRILTRLTRIRNRIHGVKTLNLVATRLTRIRNRIHGVATVISTYFIKENFMSYTKILENLEKLDLQLDEELNNEINVVSFENGLSANDDRFEILEIIAEERVSS
jgi:hypothetical protein